MAERARAGEIDPAGLSPAEAMAVGTAMPTAVTELDGLAWYAWPFSAYLVASVVGMVLGGGLVIANAAVAVGWMGF